MTENNTNSSAFAANRSRSAAPVVSENVLCSLGGGNGEYTVEHERIDLDAIYARVQRVIPKLEWLQYAPIIEEIHRLKREMNAVILAHNYQTAEIFHCVADIGGDSLQLAVEAAKTDADVILVCGVHFMAETAKLLNPSKVVLLPALEAGCSLAESITASDVRGLKRKYPGVPVATYVNTSAEVKAESDVCITSSNAVKIIESLGVPRVICLPDQFLARNVAAATSVEIIEWPGRCMVHEQFEVADLTQAREMYPGVSILAHPECPPEVLDAADFSGSTAQMIKWVKQSRPAEALMLTECSMSDNVAAELPETAFVKPCHICPHMKRITLQNVLSSLKNKTHPIEIDSSTAAPARLAIQRMIDLSA